MTMTRIHASDLLRWINNSRIAAMGTDRAEVRSLSFVVESLFFYHLIEPGFYILFVPESLTWKVAGLSQFGRWPVALVFIGAALMLVPHLVTLAFFPDRLGCQWPRALAARAGLFGATVWIMLAYLSVDLDYEWLTTFFGARVGMDLWVSTVFGLSLNAQQAREKAAAIIRLQRLQSAVHQAQKVDVR
jgi:hypothetical protein